MLDASARALLGMAKAMLAAKDKDEDQVAAVEDALGWKRLKTIVDEAEAFVSEATERERTSTELGELLMNRLKKLDKVAYVRFASVYLDFKDVKEFMSELKGLLKDRSKK